MKQKIINLLLILMIGVTTFGARPVHAQEEPTIDLSLDRNGNQISDAVEEVVATLQALPEEMQSAEIESFVSKLPISAETMALQERAQEFSMSLSTATPEEAQGILQELAEISSKLQEDPVIQKFESDLLSLTGLDINDSTDDGTTPSLSVAFSSLKKGDILARRSGWIVLWPWAMKYEHLGNYSGNSWVFESNPDGVRLKPLSDWKVRGHYVGLAQNKFASSTTMAQAVEWAKGRYGTDGRTPYNYNFVDKSTDARLYCSQLTWKIHSRAGYNLDSNHWLYQLWVSAIYGTWAVIFITNPAVAPDEVMLSPNVSVYSEGWY